MMVALAMPPPSHIVWRPYRPPVRSSSCSRVAMSLAREHPGGEGLVDLEQVDVADAEAGPVEHLAGGGDGAGQHHHRVDPGQGEGVEPGPGGETELLRLVLAHD